MNNKKAPGGLTARQAGAVCFVGLLPPATRLLPGLCARLAGRAAWLCPIAALPVLLIVAWLMKKLTANAAEGENLAGLIRRGLGRWAGGAVLIVYGLWLVAYAGFSLRSSASRFIYTIYPGAPPWPFVIAGLVMGLFAVLAPVKALARASELFRWLLVLALVPILVLGFLEADVETLTPVYFSDAVPVLEGALSALGTGAFLLVNIGFQQRRAQAEAPAPELARPALLMALLVAVTVGRFGHELTGRLTYPFFALVRNTSVFGVTERIEALVTALWVLSDFVLFAFALSAGSGCLRLAFGLGLDAVSEKRALFDLRGGRWLIWLCAALSALTAALIAPDSAALALVSQVIAPGVNLLMLFGLALPALLIGRIRGKI